MAESATCFIAVWYTPRQYRSQHESDENAEAGCFADGSAAAEVTLSGNTISALSLRPRQYSAASAASPLLPLRQAMAIAGRTAGAELSIGYADTGVYPLSAVWLTD